MSNFDANTATFDEFLDYYYELYKRYRRYGEITLNADFQENKEGIKNIFFNSKNNVDFKNKLTDYWRANFQFIINSYSDIEIVYLRGGFEQHIFTPRYSGNHQFVISKKLYKNLCNQIRPKFMIRGYVDVKVNNHVYVVDVYRDYPGKKDGIIIQE